MRVLIDSPFLVIPAKAGTHFSAAIPANAGIQRRRPWVPAFAGMTSFGKWVPAFAGMTIALLLASACGSPDTSGDPAVPSTHPLLADSKCGGCRIVAETLAVLGQEADTIAINEGATPVADSRGRFYLLEKGGSSILVFGPDGRFIRSFGRPGAGPGEFRYISEIHVSTGDTLLVIGGGVVHVVAPDYTHIRQTQLQQGGDATFFNTVLSDGRILRMSGPHTFDILDKNGVLTPEVKLRSTDTTTCAECGLRTFREALELGTVWSAPQNSYRIDRHNLSGELLQGFTRRINWFPDWVSPKEGQHFDIMTELTRPRMFGVRQDSAGLIWTHVLMVDDPTKLPINDMMTAMQQGGDNAAGARQIMSDLMSNFVTMVEVIDPVSREVLATRELKMIVVPMMRDMVAHMRLDRHGDWTCVVMRLRVEGRG